MQHTSSCALAPFSAHPAAHQMHQFCCSLPPCAALVCAHSPDVPVRRCIVMFNIAVVYCHILFNAETSPTPTKSEEQLQEHEFALHGGNAPQQEVGDANGSAANGTEVLPCLPPLPHQPAGQGSNVLSSS